MNNIFLRILSPLRTGKLRLLQMTIISVCLQTLQAYTKDIHKKWNHTTELCSKQTDLYGFRFSGKQNWKKRKTLRIRMSTIPQDFSYWEYRLKTRDSKRAAELTLETHSGRYQHYTPYRVSTN